MHTKSIVICSISTDSSTARKQETGCACIHYLTFTSERTSVRVCNRSIPQDDRGLWLRATAGWSPSNLYSVSPLPGCGGCWPISMSDLTRWTQQMRRRVGQLQDKYRSCFRDLSAQVPITDITSTSDSVKFSRKSPAVPTCSSLSDVSCAYCDSEGTQAYDMEV